MPENRVICGKSLASSAVWLGIKRLLGNEKAGKAFSEATKAMNFEGKQHKKLLNRYQVLVIELLMNHIF